MGRLTKAYRRLPTWPTFILSAIIAWLLAFVLGLAGGFAGMYLYDRAQSKGDDFAVGLIGLHAVGTFVFIFVFSCLRNVHQRISWRTPAFSLYVCLAGAAITTLLSWADLDEHYLPIVSVGWIVILLCGLAGTLVSSRLFVGRQV
jgi:hypothetical protein